MKTFSTQALLLVGLFACGGEKPAEATDPEDDFFTILAEEEPVADAERIDELGAPNGSRQSETFANQTSEYQALLEAQDAEWQARCGCEFEARGFETADTCFRALRRPDFDRNCSLQAFEAGRARLALVNSCFAEARQFSADCIVDSGCEAQAECESERDTLRRRCQFSLPSAGQFLESNQACQRRFRLGEPSPLGGDNACPQVVGESTLGQRVFVGTTTGQGDRVAFSCGVAGSDSPDVSHQWTAPATGRYLFDTIGTRFVAQLAVFDGCGGSELACSSGRVPRLSLALTAGQTVLLAVEGSDILQSGYYALNIQQLF